MASIFRHTTGVPTPHRPSLSPRPSALTALGGWARAVVERALQRCVSPTAAAMIELDEMARRLDRTKQRTAERRRERDGHGASAW